MVTITTLIENLPANDKRLCEEHGLSLYIEVDGKNILFDTGQTGKFIANAKCLHKSLDQIDTVILSHGHYDHSGGLLPFLDSREQSLCELPLTLYMGKEYFLPKYKFLSQEEGYHYNGNPFSEEELRKRQVTIHKVEEDCTYLTENCMIFKNFEQANSFEKVNPRFYVKKETYVKDSFQDEMVLGIQSSKGLIVVVGCSHVGIINILSTIQKRTALPIYAVLGGTHLVGADDIQIQHTIEELKRMNVATIAVSHCTGLEGMQRLHEAFQNRYIVNNTGNSFRVIN